MQTTRTGRRGRAALLGTLLALVSLGACAGGTGLGGRSTRVESTGSVDPNVIPVDASSLPAGATIEARLDQTLGTQSSKAGDTFTATVQNAVTAQDGAVVVPAGAQIQGRVTAVEPSPNATRPAVIRLDFTNLSFGGRSYPFQASVARAAPQTTGGATREETVRNAGIGAAAGAVLGAVLGDADLRDLAIGAVLGAAAGTAISLGTGSVDSSLPAGTTMTLRTSQAVALR